MEKTATMLWFDTDAEGAAEHYVKAIPGSKITGVECYGKAGPGPEGSVMLVSIELAGRPMLLLNGGPLFTPNESVSFVIHAEDQREVDFLWAHMSDGGKTSQCGWLKDRWGFSWQIVPRRFFEMMQDKDAARKNRIFAAMLQMTKFDIAALEKAYAGDCESPIDAQEKPRRFRRGFAFRP
jgi:predicted 3-demethylubiquinone-9 3-methyltransferase (glyoxalase superfamily)